jgi:hypothetical protein
VVVTQRFTIFDVAERSWRQTLARSSAKLKEQALRVPFVQPPPIVIRQPYACDVGRSGHKRQTPAGQAVRFGLTWGEHEKCVSTCDNPDVYFG